MPSKYLTFEIDNSSVLGGHVIELLDVVISLGLVGLLELSEARTLSIDGLEVVAQLVCDLILIGQDEHAADRAEHLLLSLQRLQLINRL